MPLSFLDSLAAQLRIWILPPPGNPALSIACSAVEGMYDFLQSVGVNPAGDAPHIPPSVNTGGIPRDSMQAFRQPPPGWQAAGSLCALQQCFSNLSGPQIHLGCLVTLRLLKPTPGDSGSVGLGQVHAFAFLTVSSSVVPILRIDILQRLSSCLTLTSRRLGWGFIMLARTCD